MSIFDYPEEFTPVYDQTQRQTYDMVLKMFNQGQKLEHRVKELESRINKVINWPPKEYDRVDKEGYPTEYTYDDFAYFRIIDFYRDWLKRVLNSGYKEEDNGV